MKNIGTLFAHSVIDGVCIESANCGSDVLHEVIAEFKRVYLGRWIGINLIGETFLAVVEFLKKTTPDGTNIYTKKRNLIKSLSKPRKKALANTLCNTSGWIGLI
jgi:hypothetical protein